MSDQTTNLLDLNPEELEELLKSIGQEKYRAKQIFQWLHKGISDIDEMSNLSKELRSRLKEIAFVGLPEIQRKQVSKIDGTAKYLLKLKDGNIIESVLMEYKHGMSACISSQVGCLMGCRFCASSGIGFERGLSPGEMLGEILIMQKDSGKRISNIVIMGIGEPLDNYDNAVKFLRLVNRPEGINIGFRHISLSTCGLVPKILELAEEDIPLTLSISLHAPNDQIRDTLMPVNKKYNVDELLKACKIYLDKTGRRISFEYAMISGVNDSTNNALELAGKLKGMLCHVNLIPVNSIENGVFVKSSKKAIEDFIRILESRGIETTVRRELGSDIEAACGQLRKKTIDSNDV